MRSKESVLTSFLEMQKLQEKADQWDERYKLHLNQQNGMMADSKRFKRPGGYFANMSDFEKNKYQKWLQSGGLKAYPNQEERERAWLMYRRGTIDVRDYGSAITDKEYQRHLAQAGLENPFRKRLSQLKSQATMNYGNKGVPTESELKAGYKKARRAGSAKEESDPLKELYDEYKSKIDEANRKNEERYAQIEKQLQDRHMRGVEGIKGQENAELQKNVEDYLKARDDLAYQYESNTSVGDAFKMRSIRDEKMAATQIRSDAKARRVALDMQLDKDLADFRERREDVAPDIGLMAQIAEKLGRGNNGRGFDDDTPAGERPVKPGSGGSSGSTGSHMQQAAQNYRPMHYASGRPLAANPYGQAVAGYFGGARSRPQSRNVYSGENTGYSPQQLAQMQQMRARGDSYPMNMTPIQAAQMGFQVSRDSISQQLRNETNAQRRSRMRNQRHAQRNNGNGNTAWYI